MLHHCHPRLSSFGKVRPHIKLIIFPLLIPGTGSNSAYVEQANKVEKFVVDGQSDADDIVVIDSELGYFGDAYNGVNGALDEFTTEIDDELDRNSIRPGGMR